MRDQPSERSYFFLPQCTSIGIQTKDDSLVLLTTSLIHTFFNTTISPEISQFCRLSLNPKVHDFESMVRIEKILISCVRNFQVDPPCFRICTYAESKSLAIKLLDLYCSPELPLPSDLLYHLKLALKTSIERITPYLFGKKWEQSLSVYYQISN